MPTTDLEIFRKAVVLIVVLFIVLISAHVVASRVKKKPVTWARLSSQVILYVIILLTLALPPIALTVFTSVILFLGVTEIYRAVKVLHEDNYHPLIRSYTQAAAVLYPFLLHFSPPLILPYLIVIGLGLFGLPLVVRQPLRPVTMISHSLICLISAAMLSCLVLLRKLENGLPLCLFLIFLTNAADSTAFMFGRMFGKRQAAPLISPGKTVEGTLLSLLTTLSIGLFCKFYLLPQYRLWQMLLFSLVIGLGAFFGDLIFSAFKREAGVKDYGSLIPGHGGVLDRFDSLILTTPVFYYLVLLVTGQMKL